MGGGCGVGGGCGIVRLEEPLEPVEPPPEFPPPRKPPEDWLVEEAFVGGTMLGVFDSPVCGGVTLSSSKDSSTGGTFF